MEHNKLRSISSISSVLIFLCLAVSILISDVADASRTIVRTRQGEKIGSYKNSFALLVGVSDYTKGWPDLEQIPMELNRVENILKEQGFTVERISDPDAEEMEVAFNDFIDAHGYEPENRLLFYYSGHGYTMDNGSRGFLVPTDAPDPRKSPRDFKRKALDMNQILSWSRQIDAHHALFLFDSCFSGVIFKQKDLPATPPHITKLTARPVRQFITAGSAGESVPAKSTFTPAFVDAIKHSLGDLNKDGYVSGTELGLHLQTIVSRCTSQSPQYGKIKDYNLSRGDFIFKVAGGEPPPFPQPSIGSIRINTRPSRANIYIDNQFKGQAPLDITGVSSGEHQVLATLDGYTSKEKKVAVHKGRMATITVELEPAKTRGRLFVRPSPGNARVRIMNIPDKYYDGIDLDPGRYQIKVSSPGYITKSPWVEIGTSGTASGGIDLYVELEEEAAPPGPGPDPTLGQVWKEPVTGMEFIWVPGGEFMMGSNAGDSDEKPVHKIHLDGFWMGKYEVTQGQWQQIMGNNPSSFKKGNDFPVEQVSWNDANSFIKKLNNRAEQIFSLPLEAQWEYAARSGGKNQKYSGGDDVNHFAWYDKNSSNSTHKVGTKMSNDLGIHDMSGNVWEWCQDIYAKDAYKKHSSNNPLYAQSGSNRVNRGGGWFSRPTNVRCANRGGDTPGSRGSDLGFRLLRIN